MPALVGQPHRDAITLRDAAGTAVSGAGWTQSYARRQDGTAIAVTGPTEDPPGSGLYPFAFTPNAAQAHHLWLTAYKAAAGSAPEVRQHWAATVYPVTAAVPVEHLAGAAQEELLVLVDAAGVPIGGATFAVTAGSVIAPATDPFAPTVVATDREGAYLLRFTPHEPGYRRAEVAATTTTPVQRFVAAYDVLSGAAPGPPVWTVTTNRGSAAWFEGGVAMPTLAIRRGDTEEWTVVVRDAAGALQNLAGASVWWTVRPYVPRPADEDLPDALALIKAWWQHDGGSVVSSGVVGPDGASGGTFTADAVASGQLRLRLLPKLTTTLPLTPTVQGASTWRYDVQIAFGPDEVHTLDEGNLTIAPDVTRRTSVP